MDFRPVALYPHLNDFYRTIFVGFSRALDFILRPLLNPNPPERPAHV